MECSGCDSRQCSRVNEQRSVGESRHWPNSEKVTPNFLRSDSRASSTANTFSGTATGLSWSWGGLVLPKGSAELGGFVH